MHHLGSQNYDKPRRGIPLRLLFSLGDASVFVAIVDPYLSLYQGFKKRRTSIAGADAPRQPAIASVILRHREIAREKSL